MDEDLTQYEQGALAVKGDSIIAVGPQDEITAEYSATETIDCDGKVLMPGLVNAHTHVPMTLLRGLADDLRLDVWLMGYMLPVEREFVSPDFVRLGASIACAEFIRSGVTTFNDMYYYEADVAQATTDAGLRAICGQTILKFPSPDSASYDEALDYARQYISDWKDHPLIVPSIAPHAAYTSTPELLQTCAQIATEYDVPLHIHVSETASEVEDMRQENDMPVVPYIKKQSLFDAKVIAAHCVHIDTGEIHTLHHHGAGVAHNPSSNLKLASGIAPVSKMLDVGLNVGIGTDGPASNNDLDMFEEIRLAAFIAKLATDDPTSLPAAQAVLMATRMGAQALHIDHLTGSLEVGKRADLILVNLKTLHNSPSFRRDPNSTYAQLVYAGKSTDVTDVMVNGQWLLRDHALLTVEVDELLEEAADYATRIDHFLIEREQSVLSKLIGVGGAMEQESFEVQIKVRIDDPEPIIESIHKPDLEILYQRHYREFDTYFVFEDEDQGYVRHREDEMLDIDGEIDNVRYRLTLVGDHREHQFSSDVLLSRSRWLAPAVHSLRFYREYFKPDQEIAIQKDRQRWLVKYQGTEFYVNIDTLEQPDLGHFLEVKSRTWSLRDAERKSEMIAELVTFLGASPTEVVTADYVELAAPAKA
ncbi:MAG: amidohydrolase [Chloroflexi bacterium]|nr:MAG: amidohydrolase [Chloroflexota bacterium]MBL1196349.1 amidohydrolase [Chloroflexota bacterium]NOH13644.1 amidohydrolase [Chloroflexota bacterium]